MNYLYQLFVKFRPVTFFHAKKVFLTVVFHRKKRCQTKIKSHCISQNNKTALKVKIK